MMHYRKGENVEKEITKNDLPFKDCLKQDTNFLWMNVKGGTKVHNVIDYAKNALDKGEHNVIVWSGQGGGVIKTVSCAEILKRYYELYQVTRTNYVKVEEHWLPQMNGLEEIIVTRQIPSIHILQSLTKIDENIRGVQQPNVKTEFWPGNIASSDGGNSGSKSGNGGLYCDNQQRGKSQQQQQQQKRQNYQQNWREQQQLQEPVKQCDTAANEGVATAALVSDDVAAETSSSSKQSTNRMNKAKRKRKPQNQTQGTTHNNSSAQSIAVNTENKNNKNQKQTTTNKSIT